jgi:hypothetical protein
VSSWRETIRTLGCLQAVAIARGFGEFKYSFRQIVTVFPAFSNRYLFNRCNPPEFPAFRKPLPGPVPIRFRGCCLKFRQKRSYTERGPKKSDIQCSS